MMEKKQTIQDSPRRYEIVSEKRPKFPRRRLLKKVLKFGLGIGVLGIAVYAVFIEPRNIQLNRKTLPVYNLPEFWEGKKIVQISDIHRSPYTSQSFIARAVDKVNNEGPNLILLTGDYITVSTHYMDSLKKELSRLKTKSKDNGKFAILGNHDYCPWASGKPGSVDYNPKSKNFQAAADYVRKGLEESGFKVLINDKAEIGPEDSKLVILGSDDMWTGKFDVTVLLSMANYEKEAIILLCHNPDIIFCPEMENKALTILSGHTHGGQVNLPFIGAPFEKSPFLQGLYKKGRTYIYVNRGLGTAVLPVRFNCSPEITVFSLCNANHRQGATAVR